MGKKALRREISQLRILIEVNILAFAESKMPQTSRALLKAYHEIERAE